MRWSEPQRRPGFEPRGVNRTRFAAIATALVLALGWGGGAAGSAHAQTLSDVIGTRSPNGTSSTTSDPAKQGAIEDPAPEINSNELGVVSSRASALRRSAIAIAGDTPPGTAAPSPPPPPPMSEFEAFVAETIGHPLPRFGASLLTEGARDFTPNSTITVPPDYKLNSGDTLLVGLAGSLEGNLQLVIDNNGQVFIPHIGAVSVAGVRYGDLQALLERRLGRQFRDFTLSISVGRIRGIRVYVTGYAASPGAYTLTSLSTLVNAVLASGGPSPGGSFRSIALRRNGRTVTELDAYDLLLNGDKSHDVILQNEDVLFIAPAGPQIAVMGSVNNEAIYEVRPSETLADVLRFAGGTNPVADATRVMVARLSNIDKMGWEELPISNVEGAIAENGSILRILSPIRLSRPLSLQAVLVTIDGEVARPGYYYLPPGSSLADALARAGDLTPEAFVYGTNLSRDSIRTQQQVGFDHALDDLQLALAAAPLIGRSASTATGIVRAQAAHDTIDVLRSRKPDGRLVLDLSAIATTLPGELTLENNDHVYIPPRPRAVGVFGAVYQPGSFIFKQGASLRDYITQAGGPQKISGKRDIFVVRANGSVVSMRQPGRRGFLKQPALPGDVIYVPVETNADQIFDRVKETANLVYQFGIGAVAIKVLAQ